MAKTVITGPVNLNMLNRQISSEASHIERIRTANSKRQIIPLWSSSEITNFASDLKLSQDSIYTEESIKRRVSMSDFCQRRKCHQNCVPPNSLDEFYEKKIKYNYLGGTYCNTVHRRKSSILLKPDANRKQSTKSKQNVKTEGNKPRKISTVKTGKENPEEPQKEIPQKRSVKIKVSPPAKMPVLKTRPSTVVKNEHGLNQISNNEGNHTPENRLSSKDVIILKWLHGLNCPFSEKGQNATDSTGIKRSSVRILKKPLNTSTNESSVMIPNNTKSPGVKNKSKSPTNGRTVNLTSKESEKSNDSDPQIEKGETDSTEVYTKDVPNVEMHVSELGKLQIILNPKSFSPEDAAVIIWIDDIPKTFFAPDYRRRLSLATKPNFQLTESSVGIMRSQSVPQFEDIAVQKPEIYFPPATILKNFAIDSKIGLKKLSEDFSNSVYYKRCNTDHALGKISER